MATSAERVCEECGGPLPPPAQYGSPRRYCSEPCRKAKYRGKCAQCGAPTSGYNGKNAPILCVPCNNIAQRERCNTRAAPNRALIEQLWAKGLTISEIIGRLDRKSFNVSHYRALGYDLPHRRTAEQVARIAEATRKALGWP